MKCEDAMLLLSGHLDHVNTEQEEAALQAHLCSCKMCRDILSAYEQADAGIASLQEKAPADLRANVMAKIKKENRKRKFRPWAGIAVAAALVLAVGVGAVMEEYDIIDLVEEENVHEPQAASEMDMQTYSRTLPVPDGEKLAQQLADNRNADVVLIHELYLEVETYECESLEEGAVLYILPDRAAAVFLSQTYGCVIYEPEQNTGETAYYALLVP